MGNKLTGIQQRIIMTLQKLIRDDIKAGEYLNMRLKTLYDFKKDSANYYVGEPIQMAFALSEFRHGDNGHSAEISIAADDFRFSKGAFKNILAKFFENGNIEPVRLQALVSVSNKQATRLLKLAGFQLEGRVRELDKSGDAYLYSMLTEEYRGLYG